MAESQEKLKFRNSDRKRCKLSYLNIFSLTKANMYACVFVLVSETEIKLKMCIVGSNVSTKRPLHYCKIQ